MSRQLKSGQKEWRSIMKTVWITGASSGIGHALALMLANNGYQVIATARNAESLKALALQSPNIKALVADLACNEAIEKLQGYFTARNQAIDVLIVNAGTCQYMDNAEYDVKIMEDVFKVNVFAAANTIAVALPWLKRSTHGGHIIGVSSMTVYLPFTRAEYYGASKAAFSYYLNSLRIDVKPFAIDVSIVYPGFVETPLTQKNDFPMPFLVSAETAAKAILAVIKKRPKNAAFPKPLHYLLRILGYIPGVWNWVHRAAHKRHA